MSASAMAQKTGYADVNGVKYYYEISGKGEPLLLLHGAMGSIEAIGKARDDLAKGHQVIAIDLHGHGRTALGDRKLNLEAQGTDMAGIVKSLGYKQVDVVGYSMGGMIAFQFAAQNPSMVRHLVLVCSAFNSDALFPELKAQQAQVGAALAPIMKGTPMYKNYAKIAPHPEEFPKLLDEIGAVMRAPSDWSKDVAKLTMPVMLIYGDSDMIQPEYMIKFFHLLGGGLKDGGYMHEGMSKNRLAILPNTTHYEMPDSAMLIPTIEPFLAGKTKS